MPYFSFIVYQGTAKENIIAEKQVSHEAR